jgi:hypothetical protein
MQLRHVSSLEFTNYPDYTHIPYFPGYVPCKDVLEGSIDAESCLAKGFGRRGWGRDCPICNQVFNDVRNGHRVVVRFGVLRSVTILAGVEHRFEMGYVEKCERCAEELREMGPCGNGQEFGEVGEDGGNGGDEHGNVGGNENAGLGADWNGDIDPNAYIACGAGYGFGGPADTFDFGGSEAFDGSDAFGGPGTFDGSGTDNGTEVAYNGNTGHGGNSGFPTHSEPTGPPGNYQHSSMGPGSA